MEERRSHTSTNSSSNSEERKNEPNSKRTLLKEKHTLPEPSRSPWALTRKDRWLGCDREERRAREALLGRVLLVKAPPPWHSVKNRERETERGWSQSYLPRREREEKREKGITLDINTSTVKLHFFVCNQFLYFTLFPGSLTRKFS